DLVSSGGQGREGVLARRAGARAAVAGGSAKLDRGVGHDGAGGIGHRSAEAWPGLRQDGLEKQENGQHGGLVGPIGATTVREWFPQREQSATAGWRGG